MEKESAYVYPPPVDALELTFKPCEVNYNCSCKNCLCVDCKCSPVQYSTDPSSDKESESINDVTFKAPNKKILRKELDWNNF